jgi:hypothetical protein
MTDNVVAAIITGFFTAGVAIFTWWTNRKQKRDLAQLRAKVDAQKIRIDALDEVRTTQERVIREQTRLIGDLRTWGQDLQNMLADVEDWAERLCCQLREAGLEPEKLIRKRQRQPAAENHKTRPRKAE